MFYSIRNGFVIYNRDKLGRAPHAYWERVYRMGLKEAEAVSDLYDEDINGKYFIAGERLISLGEREKEKERDLIEKATGIRPKDSDAIQDFIRSFNEALIGKKQFEDALKRLNHALSKEAQHKRFRAPMISSWFASKLGAALNRNINTFITNNLEELRQKDFSKWDAEFENIIDKSIDESFKELMTKMEDVDGRELYGEESTWKELYEVSQQIEGFNEYFRDFTRSVIDFNKIKNILKNQDVKINNKLHRGIRKIIDSKDGLNLQNGRRSRALGGSMSEIINELQTYVGEAAKKASGHSSKAFTSNMMLTDTVTLYTFEQSIDTSKVVEQVLDALNTEMKKNTSLIEARNNMQNFYQQHLSNLDNSFIVYGSTKAYSLTESFQGFHGGGDRPLSEAVALLERAELGKKEELAQYIRAAYSTGEGAVLYGRREEIREELKTGLLSALAELLFDDWESLGEVRSGAEAIFTLQLDGIQIPLSALLIATGKAMINSSKDLDRLAKIKISLPEKITHEKPVELKSENPGEEMKQLWEEQAQKAKKESYFSVTFLKNFKSIIREWIDII